MKECKYCGTIYADDLPACPSCGGTKIVTDEERVEEESLKRKEFENRERAIAAPQKQRKALIGGIVAVAVVVIVVIAIVSINANKPLSNGMTKDEGDQVLTEGIAFFDAGDYEAAMKCFAQLPADSKQYEKAQEMLDKCADEYSTAVIEKASTYATNGEYEVALNLLDNATELLPGNMPISTTRNTIFAEYKNVVCTKAFTEAEESAKNGDYPSAIKAVDTAIELVGQDNELTAKRTTFISGYKDTLSEEAYSAYLSDGYEAAVSVLQSGKALVGEDDDLIRLISDYQACMPISLADLDCVYGGGTAGWDYEAKMMGEEYTDYYDLLWNSDCSVDYSLAGEYKRISGKLVYNGNTNSYGFSMHTNTDDFAPTVKFYCDGNLAATYSVNNYRRSLDFSLDIGGVKFLKIEVDDFYVPDGTFIGPDWYVIGGIADFNIYKNVIEK